LSAQPDIGGLCKRLLAALSLVVAATLGVSATGLAGGTRVQNADAVDRALLSGLKRLVEDERPRSPDAAAGDPRLETAPPVAHLVAPEPLGSARPAFDVPGAPRTHAARAGLTRAPPPA
jgi:hypothetical protein